MSAEHEHRIKNLVNGLISRMGGDRDPLVWESEDGDKFETSLTRAAIRVRSHDGDGLYPFVLEVLDDHGRVVDSIVDLDSSGRLNVGKLHEMLVRQHSGVDRVLSEIFDELGIEDPPYRNDPFGNPPF